MSLDSLGIRQQHSVHKLFLSLNSGRDSLVEIFGHGYSVHRQVNVKCYLGDSTAAVEKEQIRGFIHSFMGVHTLKLYDSSPVIVVLQWWEGLGRARKVAICNKYCFNTLKQAVLYNRQGDKGEIMRLFEHFAKAHK